MDRRVSQSSTSQVRPRPYVVNGRAWTNSVPDWRMILRVTFADVVMVDLSGGSWKRFVRDAPTRR
jgi:hypothetical protein